MNHYQLHHGRRSSHQQIARIVREMQRAPILDVGSAQGMLGQLIQGSGLEIDAVEPNPIWSEATKPYYRQTYTGTIESVSLPRDHYRVVVCADVLEHTVDPAAVLKQLLTHSTRDAVFVISLPNVAHIAVRLMLLFGMFPKMPKGILDKTHLHFFTRRTAIDLLRSAGLAVRKVSCTGVPLEELAKSERGKERLARIARLQEPALLLLPRLFAFQWIFIAERE